METIIAREWFKYLNAQDISRVARVGQLYARAVQAYLPEIVLILAHGRGGRALIQAAIRAGKEALLEEIGARVPFCPLFGSWAVESGNSGFVKTCLARGWYLVPLMYESAILARNEHIIEMFRAQALGKRAMADYLYYLRLKYPLFGRATEKITFKLPDIYGAAAAQTGNLTVFREILGKELDYNTIAEILGKNTSADFVSEALEMHRKYMNMENRYTCFESACKAKNINVVELFEGGNLSDFPLPDKFRAALNLCDLEMTKKIGQLQDFDDDYFYEGCCFDAYRLGYRPNINYLLRTKVYDCYEALEGACANGSIDMIKETLADMPFVRTGVFVHLGMSNNMNAIKYVLENAVTSSDISTYLQFALRGQTHVGGSLVEELLQMGASFREDEEEIMINCLIFGEKWANIMIAIKNGVKAAGLFYAAIREKKYDLAHRLLEEADFKINFDEFAKKARTESIMVEALYNEFEANEEL